jgi:hypothetical protein
MKTDLLCIFSANPPVQSLSVFRRCGKRGKLFAMAGALAVMLCGAGGVSSAQVRNTGTVTTTSLAVTAKGSAVTTVASGTVVTLTATVTAGGSALTVGQVNFCNAAAKHCTDVNLLSTAQLTKAGTATFKFVPGPGSHSFNAVFVGTTKYATSSTGAAALTVTPPQLNPTFTTLIGGVSNGNLSVQAVVGGVGSVAPTGTVSFLDASNDNAVLGKATLGVIENEGFLNAWSILPNPNDDSLAATGDFNGDGILDMVICCVANSMAVLLGNGDGTFAAGAALAAPGAAVAVADFNGDGFADLLVLYGNDTMQTFLGNGDGTFTAGPAMPVGFGPEGVAVGDFNQDGIPDFALADSSPNTVSIFLGNGDGSFTAQPPLVGTTVPVIVVAGDFNNDGIPDLLVGGESGSSIYLGNGNGTFTQGPSLPPGGGTVAVADFNGDGNLDLAFAGGTSLLVYLGNGDGTFTAGPTYSFGNITEVNNIQVGDFNGDGIPDLAFTEEENSSGIGNQPSNRVDVFLGDGKGNFAGNGFAELGYTSGFVTGDFNGDGLLDFVLSANTCPTLENCPPSSYVIEFAPAVTGTSIAAASGITLPPGSGPQQVVASYVGDSSNKASVSSAIALTAGQGTPTVQLTASPNPLNQGSSETLTATVTGSGLTPTGTVTFYEGAGLLGTGTLNSSGVATLSTTILALGKDSITASYGGDANYVSAVSPAVVVTVGPPLGTGTATVTATPSATTITNAQSVTVTIGVAGGSGQATPTGTVTLASGSYTAQQTLASGAASFTIAAGALSGGADTVTASYSGDGTYAMASGTAVVTVAPVIMAIPAPSAVSPGGMATATATLTAGSNYSGTMNLSCTLTNSPNGAQSLPTCSLSPASVAIAASGTGTSTLTIDTTAASSTAALALPLRRNLFGLGGGGALLAAVLMFGVPSRRRRWASMLVLLAVATVGLAIGCGGGGGQTTTPPSTPGTTAGSYIFTVTGTDSSSAKISTSATVTITVQ